jgi:DNA-binding Lrp family transcriptional regulator
VIDERMEMRRAQGFDPGDWWKVDREILECLAAHGAMTPQEISRQLGLSEGEATSFLAMLAREGRVRICQVTLAG